MPDTEERDFTRRVNVRFRLDHTSGEPDYFDGVPGLPALSLMEFASIMDTIEQSKNPNDPELFVNMIKLTLADESADRFIARMHDKTDPIGIDQIMEIMPWLMEKY